MLRLGVGSRWRVEMRAVTPGECGGTTGRNSATSFASVLLVLDTPVLKPDLHLFLGQTERGRDLYSAQPGQVHAGGELVLEAQELGTGKRRTQTFQGSAPATRAIWRANAATVFCFCVGNCRRHRTCADTHKGQPWYNVRE